MEADLFFFVPVASTFTVFFFLGDPSEEVSELEEANFLDRVCDILAVPEVASLLLIEDSFWDLVTGPGVIGEPFADLLIFGALPSDWPFFKETLEVFSVESVESDDRSLDMSLSVSELE